MGIADTVAASINDIIEAVAGDTESICHEAKNSNITDWKDAQIAKAVAVGAGAAVVPIAGYLTLPADLAATLRIMHRAATGICYLRLGYADDDTFGGVLAVWSGAVTLDNSLATQIAAKGLAAGATTIGGNIGIKMAIKALSLSASIVVAKKLGPKVAQKVVAKIAAKLAAKAATRWIPIVSAVAGGGVNLWFVDGICNAADEYCDFIKKIAN